MSSVAAAALVAVAVACSGNAPPNLAEPVSADAQAPSAATAGDRGLPVSAHAPSFMPDHLTGPHAGKKACPLCVYGMVPQVQIWTDEPNLSRALALAKQIEPTVGKPGDKKAVGYVVVAAEAGGKLSSESRRKIESSGLHNAFVTSIPSLTDPETGALYGNSQQDWPGVRSYVVVNRRVFQRWDNPDSAKAPVIASSVKRGAQHKVDHDIADSQLAPPWEPGQRMEIVFRLVDSSGRPLAGTKVSAGQTDVKGLYNPPGWNRREVTLSALAWADPNGEIVWRTVMPAPYPTGAEPAHVHFTATVGNAPKWRTLWFEGDPLLTSERRAWAEQDEETVIVKVDKSGPVWRVVHTFKVAD